MDGTEAAILTNERIIYHNKGKNTSISLKDIKNIQSKYDIDNYTDIILIEDKYGSILKLEIISGDGEIFDETLKK